MTDTDLADRVVPAGFSIPGVRLTALGLDLPDDLSFDAWQDIGRRLERVERSIQWLIGDWLRFGERVYGEMYAQAMEATGREYQTVANARYVASRFEPSRRRETLSFAHHEAVAPLPVPVADRLLDLAEQHNLTRQELRERVQEYKVEVQREEQRLKNPLPPGKLPPDVVLDVAEAGSLPLDDASVDLIVTSPPYNLGVDYAASEDDRGYTQYLADVSVWAHEMYRVARAGGRACINVPLDTSRGGKHPVYADYVRLFVAAGWSYQTTIVWNEQNISRRTAWGSYCQPSAPSVTAPVEMIALFFKGEFHRERNGRVADIAPRDFQDWFLGLWTFSGESPARVGHPAPFPEELPRRLLLLYSWPDDVVLDPFCGSGTTAVVCAQLGRACFAFDVSVDYVRAARERVAREREPLVAA